MVLETLWVPEPRDRYGKSSRRPVRLNGSQPGSLKRQHRARAAHDNERKTKARKDLGVVDGTV
jgi:hypothetical protein